MRTSADARVIVKVTTSSWLDTTSARKPGLPGSQVAGREESDHDRKTVERNGDPNFSVEYTKTLI